MKTSLQQHLENQPNYIKNQALRLIQFIQSNISNTGLGVLELALEAGMSERQLYRWMQHHFNTTPNLFIRQIKMERARRLLEVGEYSTVSELAYALGYKQPAYFTQVFEHSFGVKPIDFKRC
ncbi:MAG: helix-turn-helix transcriptional regulator [Saprospiraceae bacterium]|nr:helix-turn-helix transcriptional regulator [Saprospiraceae bacterium]